MNSPRTLFQTLAAALCLAGATAFAQQSCGNDLLPKDPEKIRYKAWYEKQFMPAQKPATVTYTIPVVVHVIETGTVLGSPEKPSDAQIIASIDALNKTFSATYPGYPTATTGGVEVGFHFELARRDPNCNPTNGINRIDKSQDAAFLNTYITMFDTHVLTALARWNVTEYCNFYVCTRLINGGFATPPMPGYIGLFDGIALSPWRLPPFYNVNPPYIVPNPPYTITHEFGHYLGLTHTFNMANDPVCPPNANCLTQGDQICDTDPHPEACPTATCNVSSINPCTGQPLGSLFSNFMSYFTDTIGLFTPGQKAWMHQQTGLYRSSLYTSMGATPPQPSVPTIGLMAQPQNSGYLAYCSGDSVTFYVTGSGHGSSPLYTWYINGVVKATTTTLGPKTFALHTTDTVTCRVTSSALCASTPTVMSAKYAQPVTLGGILAPLMTHSSNDTVCHGDSVIFNCVNSSPGDFIYYWDNSFHSYVPTTYSSFPNSTSFRGVIDTLTMFAPPAIPGWIRYTANNIPLTHCTTPAWSVARDSVYLVRPPARPVLSFGPGYLQCTPAPTYQWYSVSTGSIAGATSQTFVPVSIGDYYCVVSNRHCHSRPSDTLHLLTTDVASQELNNSISVYPNPASDLVLVKSSGSLLQHVEILSLSGQLIRSLDPAGHQAQLVTGDLANGLYFLKITDQTGYVCYRKLLVEQSPR